MKDITKRYSNGEVTIIWKPALCTHSRRCWQGATGLPQVFNPFIKPWINPLGADTATIIQHIQNCPSGALSFYMNRDERIEEQLPDAT